MGRLKTLRTISRLRDSSQIFQTDLCAIKNHQSQALHIHFLGHKLSYRVSMSQRHVFQLFSCAFPLLKKKSLVDCAATETGRCPRQRWTPISRAQTNHHSPIGVVIISRQ